MKSVFLASRLKHRMTLQEQVRDPDGAGGFTSEWEDLAQLWGEIMPVGGAPYFGKEYVSGNKMKSLTRYKITVRYRRRVTTEMRLVVEDKVLRILAVVEPMGIKRSLEILAEEHV